jgi:hypothetical protein
VKTTHGLDALWHLHFQFVRHSLFVGFILGDSAFLFVQIHRPMSFNIPVDGVFTPTQFLIT